MSFNGKARRVVVTGMGAATPIGLTVADFWKNALAGMSGAAPITYFDTTQYDTKFAAELKRFDPLNYMDRKMVQRVDPFTQYAFAAADEAVKIRRLTSQRFRAIGPALFSAPASAAC